MGALYENIIRPLWFLEDAERAHDQAVFGLRVLAALRPVCRLMADYNSVSNSKPIDLLGLKFPNYVGMAAGFDKNGDCWPAAEALGFGHVEIGTVTYQRQPGNPRPRLFRYPKFQTIVNRMGFNNEGAEAVAKKLAKSKKHRIPLGVNIGKTKAVSIEHAAEDYLKTFNTLADYADYFVVNVSSPNTPGLRTLQGREHLPVLLGALRQANLDRAHRLGVSPRPMLVKLSPDLTFTNLDEVLEIVQDTQMDGVVAVNTSTRRPESLETIDETGGLSGAPLHRRSTEMINYIYKSTSGKLPIIGVGGIIDEKTAGQTMDAGASLIQVYTGMIFKGPFFARNLGRALAWKHRKWV